MHTLGSRIREARKERGLTQEALGEKAGIQKSAVAKYENNRIETPNAEVIRAFAQALGTTEAYLNSSLIKELEARWQFNKKKNWDPEKLEGTYYLRGRNRKFAQEHNLPTAYNRLALMAVSVFHLSHWRLDVTVCNYILAV